MMADIKRECRVLFMTPSRDLWDDNVKRPWISTQPLGLAYIAASTRNANHTTKVIDAYSLGLSVAELRSEIEAYKPQVVGISSLTPQWPDAEAAADIVKDVNADTLVVAGGPHVTALPQEAAGHPSVDVAVIGEGEEAMVEICDAVATGGRLEEVAGIVIAKNGSVKHTGDRPKLAELDSLQFPAHDLLPETALYNPFPAWGTKGNFSCIISGRGCPYNCRFCDVTSQQGKRYRLRSAENVVDELEWLNREFGATQFSFRDPSMICNRRRLMEMCRLIGERNLDIVWTCNSRANEVDPEMLAAMRRAGCRLMQYGIEVGNAEMLREIKKISRERVAQAVSDTRRAGISAHGFFLFGFIEETSATIEETISFAKELDLDSAGFAVMVPFPGTREFEQFEAEGLLLSKNWLDYNVGKKPVYYHRNLSQNELQQATRRAYRQFYLRPSIIHSHLRKMKSLQTLKVYVRSAKETLF